MDRESFFCPITRTVMQDPVVDPEGNSFEREAIENWLKDHQTSPITRAPLHVYQLIPNRALREVIQEELRKSNESGETQWMAPKESVLVPPVAIPQEEVTTPPVDPEVEAKAEEVELTVTSATEDASDIIIHTSISPGPGLKRSPADICCVVDISGSMGAEATVKTGTGKEEKHGLSLLDVVKHAVKTVVHSLEPNDRFALVVFSTTARVVFDLTYIGQTKDRIFSKIDGLEPEDTTNLWDGLVKGLDILKASTPGRASAIILLTDGLPNISPPRGELAMLKRYISGRKQLATTINTFGFGYSIDTSLLHGIAIEGHGMYSFIPDASFVGTAFVNCISNLLVTMGRNVELTLELQHGVKVTQVLGGYAAQPTPSGTKVNVVSLQYGQTKDVLVRLSVPPTVAAGADFVSVTLRFESVKSGEVVERTASCSSLDYGRVNSEIHKLRLAFVSTVSYVLELVHSGKDKEAQAALDDIAELVRQCQDPRAKALLQDITGQAKEAIQKTPENYYQKWGRHYLPSLARAHLLQQCNNFKDPGIQVYGGEMFQQKRDQIDDIFVKLPPPKPSIPRRQPPSPMYSMHAYHNAAGPCFAGECLVQMASGTKKQVRDIVRGDVVMVPTGPAEVECVIKTHCVDGKEDLVIFPSGLRVTPYHPVLHNGNWRFPIDLHPIHRIVPCDAVYNFVLRTEHVMVIQGVPCVTLGHGIIGDEVVSHAYFGTSRVVADLRAMRGWHAGLVELYPVLCAGGSCMLRDKATGLVCGFVSGVSVGARDM
jgi:Mg-chelatase subunit ChlD